MQLAGDVLEADGVVARCADGINCFLAGTQVITGINADGTYQTEQIQNITVGQTVLTKNQNDPNGPLQQETVTAVQVHTVYALRDVTIQNADGSVETIDTTDSHPFYVQGQGWVSADDLTAGETLSTPDGQTATVVGTTTVAEPQGVLVYNFTLADDHTYFVEGFGSNGTTGSSAAPLDAVWVHNSCLRAAMEAAGEKFAPGEQAAHIVPENIASRSAEVQDSINTARAIIKRNLGEDGINSAVNGFKATAGHLGTHTDAYLRKIGGILKKAEAAGGKKGVEEALATLRKAILNERFVKE